MTNNTTAADLDRDIAHLIESSESGIACVPRETLVRLRALLTSPRAAVQASANLEGLRKKLLTPREVSRDEQGWLTHPDMPWCDEDVRADEFLAAFHIDTAFVSMESDGNEDACEAYFERGDADCSAWTPTPPTGEGWLLLEIYDTEDGPYALYGRDRYEVELAEKRAHTKRLRERLRIDAAPAAPVAELQWLSIETAPKDGVQILLSNGTEVQQGWWMHDEGGTTEHRDMDGRWIGQDDRDGYIGWWDVSGGMQPCPDRWMPMPPPLAPASAEPVTALVMHPLTDAALCEALDEFELVCENNDVRRLTDHEKYAAQEFALSLIQGDPSAAQAVAADGAPTDYEKLLAAVGTAYGYLWHINEMTEAPIPHYSPAKAAYASRRVFREFLTSEQRVIAINEVGREIGRFIDDAERAAVSPATADERAAFVKAYVDTLPATDEFPDKARDFAEGVIAGNGVSYRIWNAALAFARASQAAAPQANAAEESEDAYVIRRLSETLADVAVTLRGDDPVHPDDPLNKIELVKRLAEVLRMEVELYRAQAAAPAEAREPVATLHDDGHYVWNPKVPKPEGYDRAGWKMAVYGVPADAGEAVALTAAARDVLAERARQVSVEGWTPEHDDQYTKGELALAASQYVLHVACPFQAGKVPAFWPWANEWWKPTTPRRDLEKAGALIQAEIERLDRAEAREQGAQGGKGGEA